MDQRLLFLINRAWTHPALDRIMAAASSFDLWLPWLLLLAAAVAWKGRTRARWFLVCLAAVLLVNDALIGDALKHLTLRLRPFQAVPGVRQIDLEHRARPRLLGLFLPLDIKVSTGPSVAATLPGSGRSFPSNHTTNNFCAATLLTLFYRWRGALAFLPAAVVGYSRVYVGAHWPSDVFASACLASGWVLTATGLLRLWLLNHPEGPLARWRPAVGLPPDAGDNHSP